MKKKPPPLLPAEYIKPYSTFAYRCHLIVDHSVSLSTRPRINSADAACKVLREWFAGSDREEFAVMLLDSRDRLVGINTVGVGSLLHVAVEPREVFKPAILSNCCHLIIAHNHPTGGNPQPSNADYKITKALVSAGLSLAIHIVDHCIITDGDCYSFADGLIPNVHKPLKRKEKSHD